MTRRLPIGELANEGTAETAASELDASFVDADPIVSEQAASDPDDDGASDPADALVGRVLAGRYRATKVLGRGGIGVVLEGVHLELDKRVAIKVLQGGYARDAEALERFEREARTAAKIGHPNIVAVLDLGRLETGEPFFVMEHLEGRDLEEDVTSTGARVIVPVARALSLLEAVAGALDALHREGIIHRDVKPANVFLARSSQHGEQVKLVDFGLATLADAERKGKRLTREGFIVGTAEYIAPECARGALGGPAADVYSLAVVAFELLSGVLPFSGPPIDVVMQKVGSVAPLLSSITRRRYPLEVDTVLARALDRDPKRRPKSCGELVQDLRVALSRPLATADPADDARSTTDELPRVGGPSRSAVVVSVVALLIALGAGAVGWSTFGSGSPDEESAVATTAPTSRPEAELVVADPGPAAEDVPTGVEEPVAVAVAADPAPTGADTPGGGGPGRRHGERHPVTRDPASDLVAVAPVEPPPRVAPPPEPTPAVAPEPPVVAEPTVSAADLVREAQSALLHGEAARARDLFRDATRTAPRHGAAWRGLGIASEQLHESAEARRAFERYLEISPDAPDAASIRTRLERLGG